MFSGRNPTLVIDCTSYSLEELSVAGFTPEVVENFGAEYFDVELQKKWEKIGKVPKEKVREVEDKLRNIESRVRTAEQDHWRKSDPASIDRSNSVITQLESAIEKLEAALKAATATNDQKKIAAANEALAARKAWLETVKTAAN